MLSGAALSQHMGACSSKDTFIKHLKTRFNEEPVATGLVVSGKLLVMFASPDGATWTALSIDPSGVACMVASGKNWEFVSMPLPGQKL